MTDEHKALLDRIERRTKRYGPLRIGELLDLIDRYEADMAEINRICHVPTPGAQKAAVHFQSDFDRIRALSKPSP